MSLKVLVGANVDIFIKGRRLKSAVSLTFSANAKEICTAKIRFLEMDDAGKIKRVEYRGRYINKQDEFEAFVTSINTKDGQVRFDVFPRSFIRDGQNDFTVDDEKFLLDEILKCCEPAPEKVPPETL